MMKRALSTTALLLAFVAMAAACDDGLTDVDPRDVSYAPELEVDLDAMIRAGNGLYHLDIEVGTGPAAVAGDTVSVLYRGWLSTGTLIDERQNPDNPFRFPLGIRWVIDGWDQGVAGMRVGGTRKLVVPPALGYGRHPYGPIPGNSVLVFEIEVVALE